LTEISAIFVNAASAIFFVEQKPDLLFPSPRQGHPGPITEQFHTSEFWDGSCVALTSRDGKGGLGSGKADRKRVGRNCVICV